MSISRARLIQLGEGLLVVALFLGLSAWFLVAQPDVESLLAFGYPGLFAFMAITSATLFLPLPGFFAVIGGGILMNPLLVAIVAGFGSALGEMTGYLAGRGGRMALTNKTPDFARRCEGWLNHYGDPAIFVCSVTPTPFDAVGIVAGSMRYSARRFYLSCAMGKVVKYAFLAFAGKTVFDLFVH